MQDESLISYVDMLRSRALADGGFASHPTQQHSRPDATAWAILALDTTDTEVDLLEAARLRLAADQLADGRVSLSKDHPEVFWPTPLAILAW